MQRTLTFDKGFRLFNRALSSNATRLGVTSCEWDVSGNCTDKQTVEFVGRRERFLFRRHEVQPRWNDPTTWESVSVIMHCKCRKCEPCLKRKRLHWYFRAKAEVSKAPRTWFGSLTYNDQALIQRWIMAERRCVGRGIDWHTLDPDEKFRHLLDVAGDDVTKFIKVLRKRSPGPLRYLLVSERQSSGARGDQHPHWHVFIHESYPPITHRTLKGDPKFSKEKGNKRKLALPCWPHGFSDFKLAEASHPGYLAKYISKDLTARVRCSQDYGSVPTVWLAPTQPTKEAGGG